MTDEMQNSVSDQLDESKNDQTNISESQGFSSPQTIEAPKAPDKSFNQYQVNDIVKDAKREAAEKVRREYEAKLASINSQGTDTSVNQNLNQTSLGGQVQYGEDQIRQMISEQSQRLAMEQAAHHMASEFIQKLEKAKERYQDLDQKVADLELTKVPQIVQMTNGFDNTADVIYELANNPNKFSAIVNLSYTHPRMAERQLQELSNSIKQNTTAANQNKAPEPLSQIKPSTIGTDNGSMSLRDLKNADWLKG